MEVSFTTVSQIIKERLQEINMSQTELASALGTTRQNLSNKISRDNFTAKELAQIADVLNLKVIFKDSDKEYILNY